MLGLTGVLVALVVLTIMLAGVFLVRPSITAGATGKILAFIAVSYTHLDVYKRQIFLSADFSPSLPFPTPVQP